VFEVEPWGERLAAVVVAAEDPGRQDVRDGAEDAIREAVLLVLGLELLVVGVRDGSVRGDGGAVGGESRSGSEEENEEDRSREAPGTGEGHDGRAIRSRYGSCGVVVRARLLATVDGGRPTRSSWPGESLMFICHANEDDKGMA
jgi:hypothetical protein